MKNFTWLKSEGEDPGWYLVPRPPRGCPKPSLNRSNGQTWGIGYPPVAGVRPTKYDDYASWTGNTEPRRSASLKNYPRFDRLRDAQKYTVVQLALDGFNMF